MPTFQYQALDENGKKRKGFIESDSQAVAFSQLQERGLVPVKIKPVAEKAAPGEETKFRVSDLLPTRRVRVGEAFYYLGLMLQSGSSLAQSLDLLGRMSGGRAARLWLNVRDEVEAGNSFSQALTSHPRIFSRVYVGMIQVAENVGRLGEVLEKIAQYEEQRAEVSGRLITAMVYPSVVFLVGAGAVYFLLSRVLPKIAGIFAQSDKALPYTTQALLAVGEALQNWGVFAALIPFALIFVFVFFYRRNEGLKYRVDKLLWKAPLFQKYALARFAGMLGFQLEAGIPLVQAMDSSAAAVGSSFFKRQIMEARNEVASGQPFDQALAKRGVFPEIFILTLSSGQRAGKLGAFLTRISRILERETDNILKRVVALAEPILILTIGLIIAGIVLAIMGPIFDLTSLVK